MIWWNRKWTRCKAGPACVRDLCLSPSSQLAMADSTSAFLQGGESNFLYGAVDRYK
jgi:hypothetical protein